MKRSLDFTMQAMVSENVEKTADPSAAANRTPAISKGFQLIGTCIASAIR